MSLLYIESSSYLKFSIVPLRHIKSKKQIAKNDK